MMDKYDEPCERLASHYNHTADDIAEEAAAAIHELKATVAELQDDLTISRHLCKKQLERARRAEAEIAECRKKCERLKLHAEAMDAATISHVDGRDLLAELHLNRAHYCDIRVRINGEYRTHEGDWLKNLQRERNAYRADFPKE